MAENVTLARPYAEAAFQLARGGNALDAWSVALSRLSAVTARPEMEECIGNPRMGAAELAQLCVDVASSAGKLDLSADQRNFVRVLADNDRLIVLPEISGPVRGAQARPRRGQGWRHRQVHRPHPRSAGRPGAARPRGQRARPADRRQGPDQRQADRPIEKVAPGVIWRSRCRSRCRPASRRSTRWSRSAAASAS
jgi:hypothetical protein